MQQLNCLMCIIFILLDIGVILDHAILAHFVCCFLVKSFVIESSLYVLTVFSDL